jgi:hypothetical protein
MIIACMPGPSLRLSQGVLLCYPVMIGGALKTTDMFPINWNHRKHPTSCQAYKLLSRPRGRQHATLVGEQARVYRCSTPLG